MMMLRIDNQSKLFIVQIISSFGGLAYTAFFEHDFEGNCGDGISCMGVISKLVATILIERFAFTWLFDNVSTKLLTVILMRCECCIVDSHFCLLCHSLPPKSLALASLQCSKAVQKGDRRC
jgi:hypothetical protein